MDIATLKTFCHTYHDHLLTPFYLGEHTYATDGHIMIRVPKVKGIGKSKVAPDPIKLFVTAEAEPKTWIDLPSFEVKTVPCPECDGKGWFQFCNYCKGRGCKRCNHDGVVPTDKSDTAKICENCNGTRQAPALDGVMVQGAKGRTKIWTFLLNKVKDLPSIQIAPVDEKSPFMFRFDGGDGLIMGMRIQEGE